MKHVAAGVAVVGAVLGAGAGALAQTTPTPQPTTTATTTPESPPATATAPPTGTAPPPATAPPTGAPPPPPPGATAYPYPYPYPYPPPYGQYPPPYGYQYAPPAQPPEDKRPKTMDYDGGDVPAGYKLDSRARKGPIIAGAIMFGSTYFINILIADAVDDGREQWMYVPGIGTWPEVGDACDGNSGGCQIVILHSATHTIGLGLLIYGIAARKQILVREDTAFTVVPFATGSASGLAALGRF